MKTYQVLDARALDDHRLEVRRDDGLTGVVDMAARMAEPPYEALRDAGLFRDVRIYDYGHTIYWLSPDATELDICPDQLRAAADPEVAAAIADEARRWMAGEAAAE